MPTPHRRLGSGSRSGRIVTQLPPSARISARCVRSLSWSPVLLVGVHGMVSDLGAEQAGQPSRTRAGSRSCGALADFLLINDLVSRTACRSGHDVPRWD